MKRKGTSGRKIGQSGPDPLNELGIQSLTRRRGRPRRPASRADATPRAVIYARVSTKEQTRNLSLETQERACREYCEQNGWEVAEVFVEEGESAKTADRPMLKALLDFCRENRGRVDFLLFYRIDRLARQQEDHAFIRAYVQKLGVTLKSATEPIDESSTGRLLTGILAAFSQFDNDVRADRTRDGMRAKVEKGDWPFTLPVGYRRISRFPDSKAVEADPIAGPLVRRAFELMATGQYTSAEVLRKVSAMGLVTRRGKSVSPQSFRQMLRSTICKGVLSVQKWNAEVKANFEPLVPEELFERVQAILEGRGPTVGNRELDNPEFPLRRFVRCSICGSPFTGSRSTGREKTYAYYRCRRSGCGASIAKRDLEREFLKYLRGLRPKRAYVRLFREVVLDVWNQRKAGAKAERESLEKRIESIREQRQKLLRVVVEKEVDDAVYQREDDRLAQDEMLAEIALRDARVEEIDVEGVLNFAEAVILDARRLWLEGDLRQRQVLQKVLFPSGVTYDPERGFGTTETSLLFRWLAAVSSRKTSKASPTGFEPVSPA